VGNAPRFNGIAARPDGHAAKRRTFFMLDQIIRFSLHNRAIVAIASLLAMVVGISLLRSMPVDVFPDLNRPGIAYIVALLCSLAVSLTFTPVLASVLLSNAPFLADKRETLILRWLKAVDERILRWTLSRPRLVLGFVGVLVLLSCLTLPWMGGEFLPPFNEGTATANLRLEPGTSLAESQRLASRVESLIIKVPEVLSVARRTGRAELDEHAEGKNPFSPIFAIAFQASQEPPSTLASRSPIDSTI
jgi:Cu/Ag efflux pump CusA